MVTSANSNATYHLAELDETRIAIPVAGKRIKAFKKRQEGDPEIEEGSADRDEEPDEDRIGNGSE